MSTYSAKYIGTTPDYVHRTQVINNDTHEVVSSCDVAVDDDDAMMVSIERALALVHSLETLETAHN